MIVKNEEENIREILEKMDGIFDEVVILDTGSEDSSKNVAEQLGAKVFSRKWKDDFSLHRNQAIEKSSGKWIFWLDSDDRISPEDAEKIKKIALKSENYDAFIFPVTTIFKNKKIETVDMIRLFRNKTEYRFEGTVNEQIGPSIVKASGKIKRISDLTIIHNRFSIDPEFIIERNKRNLKLLKKQEEKTPRDPYFLTQLAWSAYNSNNLLLAKKTASNVLEIKDVPKIFKFRCKLLNGKLALDAKDTESAGKFFKSALSIYPKNKELLFLKGQLNRELGDNFKAIEFFEKALQNKQNIFSYPPDIPISNNDILYNIAYSLLYTGDTEKALSVLDSILKEDITHIASLMLVSEIYMKDSNFEKALEYLLKASNILPEDHDINIRIGNIYFQSGDYDNAEKAYMAAAEGGANSSEIYNNIASTFAAKGQIDKAEEFYMKSVKKNPKFHEGFKNLGYLYMRQKKFDDAIECFETAFKLKPIMREAGDRLGEIYYIKGDFKNAHRVYTNLLNMFPGDPRLYNNLGVCALNLEKTDEALKLFTSAIELYPDYKDAKENLESIIKGQGN